MCNDHRLFNNTRIKSIEFITGASQIIRTEEVGIVSIFLSDGIIVELYNLALALNCDSNLILLGQLKESGITYHDDPKSMTFMRISKVIAKAKREQNLFTLDLTTLNQAMSGRVMAIRGKGRPINLVSKN